MRKTSFGCPCEFNDGLRAGSSHFGRPRKAPEEAARLHGMFAADAGPRESKSLRRTAYSGCANIR